MQKFAGGVVAGVVRIPTTMLRRDDDDGRLTAAAGSDGRAAAATTTTTTTTMGPRSRSDLCGPRQHRPSVRILLVRHGESEGNVNKCVYAERPDHALALTAAGRVMARQAGEAIRNFFIQEWGCKANMDNQVRLWVSPYDRTRQTAEELLRSLNTPDEQWVDNVRESPFLVEQDFGAFEGTGSGMEKYSEEQRRMALKKEFDGHYWSRWPNGESFFDVCVRMSGIISDITAGFLMSPVGRPPIRTVIIVSHGVTIRAFLSVWFRYSPEWCAKSRNPPNCSVYCVDDYDDKGYIFPGFGESNKNTATAAEGPTPLPATAPAIQVLQDPRVKHWEALLQSLKGQQAV